MTCIAIVASWLASGRNTLGSSSYSFVGGCFAVGAWAVIVREVIRSVAPRADRQNTAPNEELDARPLRVVRRHPRPSTRRSR